MINFGSQSLKQKFLVYLNRYSSLEYFINLPKRNTINSTADSMLGKDFEYGCSTKDLRLKIGKPVFQNRLEYSANHMVLMYEKKVAGIDMIFEFHFFKDKLFYFNKTFPSNYFWTNDEMEILEMFCQKYGMQDTDPLMGTRIKDATGNYVFVDLCNNLTINNIDMDSDTFKEVIARIEKRILVGKLKSLKLNYIEG